MGTDGPTDEQTVGSMDGATEQRSNGATEELSYRGAFMCLKILFQELRRGVPSCANFYEDETKIVQGKNITRAKLQPVASSLGAKQYLD
jgi:hypothetical protein